MKFNSLKNPGLAIAVTFLFALFGLLAHAQSSSKDVLNKQIALRDDFISKIKAYGFTPRLAPPEIVLNNPRSWGNFDADSNKLHTCDWLTLPAQEKDVFQHFAEHAGPGMTAEKFFNLAVYKWIFMHELGHWWRACQQQTANHYQNEKAANRIAAAYWHEKDDDFYRFQLGIFSGLVDHGKSPVPASLDKEKYLEDNYDKLPGGWAYAWYQSIMNVEISKENPFPSFRQSVESAGKALQ